MEHRNTIYRVAVGGLHCRSSIELVILKTNALAGVEAASIGPDHVLTVFAEAEAVSANDIIRTLVDAGVTPVGGVSAAHVCDPISVALEQRALAETAEAEVELVDADAPIAATVPALVSAERDVDGPAAETKATASGSLVAAPNSASEPGHLTGEEAAGEPDATCVQAEESIRAAIEAPGIVPSPRASLVQRIQVTVSDDYYPNRIEVIPGVPVDIEFGEGHGCLARVLFDQFGIDQDLTDGGAIVHLPGLAPGVYGFSCGMRMVFGSVVAEA